MGITTLIVMVALLVFLAIRSRKNPLFLAGAAAYLVLGRSIFIDIWPGQAVLGLASVSVATGDLLMTAVGLGWLYARARRPVPRVRLAPLWAALGILVAFFFAVEFALALASTTEVHPMVMLGARDWFYIPLGYLMTLDVLQRFTSDETADYIRVLSFFTACASVLYVASALNVPVYSYEKSLITSFGGTTIIRDFSAMPFWAGLAWCHYLSQPRKNVWTYVALAVVASGVLMTYARSLLGLLVLTAVLATALLLLRRGQRTRGIIVGVVCAALAVVVLVLGPVVAPAQLGYLQGRFSGIVQLRSVVEVSTAQIRLHDFEHARAAGARVDPYLGAGLFDSSGSLYGAYWSPDSDWISIVYRTGWVGIIVLAAPLAVALWRGIRGFGRGVSSITASTLLLTGTLATVWFVGFRFTSAIYLWWPAVSLLSVALIARAEAIPAAAAATVSDRAEPCMDRAGLLNELSRS